MKGGVKEYFDIGSIDPLSYVLIHLACRMPSFFLGAEPIVAQIGPEKVIEILVNDYRN
jgi:hypothetical protein